MNGQFKVVVLTVFLLSGSLICHAQQASKENGTKSIFLTPMYAYEGDTVPYVKLLTVYVLKPPRFKNRCEMAEYYKPVRDVEKVLPTSREINQTVIETYEYLQTIPTEKGRQRYLKAVEGRLKKQYTPRMKKLSFSQGELLIKLMDRQAHPTSYELVKAFMGPFKTGFYQTFAALSSASLKRQYDPTGDDAPTERAILMVGGGQFQ